MTSRLHFEYIEHIAARGVAKDGADVRNGFVSSDGRIDFVCKSSSPIPEFDDAVLLRFGNDEVIAKAYRDALFTPGFVASGVLRLKDFSYFEDCALPIDLNTGRALIGEPICWGGDFAHWYAETHDLQGFMSDEYRPGIRARLTEMLKGDLVFRDAIILSAPGQNIYGHWLLDFLPRLDLLTGMDTGTMPIFAECIPEWADHFLQSFDLDRSRFRRHPGRAFRVRNALIPSSAKSGYRLGASALKSAWGRARQARADSLPEGIGGEKIFFSRKAWALSTRKPLPNIEEIEAAAEARGYKIIVPETLSIPEQIRLMEGARIVVGEDGSALHNIAFAEPGARLGVLSLPDRANLWHYGICHILQHRLAYFYPQSELEAAADLAAFHDFLDILEG